jgi:predicted transcriptional regulator
MSLQAQDPPGRAAFEDVWALLQETDRLVKENAQRQKELDRQIGKLGNRLGDVIEHLMSPKLHEKFKELDFVFNRSSRNVEIRNHDQKHLAELDILPENGEYVLAVEVKTRLTTGM